MSETQKSRFDSINTDPDRYGVRDNNYENRSILEKENSSFSNKNEKSTKEIRNSAHMRTRTKLFLGLPSVDDSLLSRYFIVSTYTQQ